MKKEIERANRHAELSCPEYNSRAFSRLHHRKAYQRMAVQYWRSKEHQEEINLYLSGYHRVNTYPWPFVDKDFAPWTSDPDAPQIVDLFGHPIRTDASYCAYKAFEVSTGGIWLKKKELEEANTKGWLMLLDSKGYINREPHTTFLQNGHYYIGVGAIRNDDAYPFLVWFENISGKWADCSTYFKGEYKTCTISDKSYMWVEIGV